jgi:glycosyltransferase involved in cell wall biosynthesis
MTNKILIDANPIVPYYALGRNNGIGRTCIELIKALDKIRDELPFEIELYTQNVKGVSGRSLNTNFKSHHVYLRNTSFGINLAKKLRLREIISNYTLQHITHNCENVVDPSKCIVTVHDAMFMKLDVDNFDYDKARTIYPKFIRNCKHVITCSEYSKKDIIELIGVPEENISVIPWGIDHDIFFEEKNKDDIRIRLRNEFGLNSPYFLSVSCDAERKRTDKLIETYLKLDNPHNDLVLVWANPPENIKRICENTRIHLISDISNDALRMLYNCATAAINPTSYEGFGLPILEAMACGCPTITCHNSSLPEVGKDIAIYIDEPIELNLPKLMHQLDMNEIDTRSRVHAGIIWANTFQWEYTSRQTAKVYAKVLGM